VLIGSIFVNIQVDYIEPDYLVHISRLIDQRNVPSWGLARLSHRAKLTLLTRSVYTYDDAAAGQGVTAYIIDTGIFAGHQASPIPHTSSLGINY